MIALNETHDPGLTSWIESANQIGCDFPIQNLPFAQFHRKGSNEPFRGGVAIGDQIVDLAAVSAAGVFDGAAQSAAKICNQPTLNEFMGRGVDASSALRLALSRALRSGSDSQGALSECLVPQAEAEYSLPCQIGDYTDFYTSVHHATSVAHNIFFEEN